MPPLKFPEPHYVRLKFTQRYAYLRVERGILNRPLISIDSRCIRDEFPDGLSVESSEKLAGILAAKIKAFRPKIPKLHLDVLYEFTKKDERFHQNIIAVADVLQKNGLRIAGYG